jgi:hypothetical protein
VEYRRFPQRWNPDAPVRSAAFGPEHQGLITNLILDEQRRVDILDVTWLG